MGKYQITTHQVFGTKIGPIANIKGQHLFTLNIMSRKTTFPTKFTSISSINLDQFTCLGVGHLQDKIVPCTELTLFEAL